MSELDAGDFWLMGVVVALVAGSAFFSGSESAITSASRPRMHALERAGNRRAALVNWLKDHKDQFISAILVGNNIVNILASALATSAFIGWLGEEKGVVYATVIMTVLVVIFGEVLPKTVALNRPDRMALILAPVVRGVMWVLYPFATALRLIAGAFIRVMGLKVRPEETAEAATEELRGAIELHGAGGPSETTVKKERQMLRSILDLADVTVADILIHRRQVVAIDSSQPVEAIIQQALSSPHTRIPLWRGQPDNVIGVLHAKALLQAVRANPGDPAAIDIAAIASRPWFIPDSTSLLDQLEAFRRRREHFALVVDEYGGLLGVVTLEDILEEIVGDMAERHEFKVPGVRAQTDGTWVVDGHVTIRDLNRQFDWRLPDESAATIAGLVLYEARRIPEVGQVFVFHGLRFEILRRKRNQIATLRVSAIDDAAAPKSGPAPASAGARAA